MTLERNLWASVWAEGLSPHPVQYGHSLFLARSLFRTCPLCLFVFLYVFYFLLFFPFLLTGAPTAVRRCQMSCGWALFNLKFWRFVC